VDCESDFGNDYKISFDVVTGPVNDFLIVDVDEGRQNAVYPVNGCDSGFGFDNDLKLVDY
jgi:hypothetical protein